GIDRQVEASPPRIDDGPHLAAPAVGLVELAHPGQLDVEGQANGPQPLRQAPLAAELESPGVPDPGRLEHELEIHAHLPPAGQSQVRLEGEVGQSVVEEMVEVRLESRL